MRIDGCSAYAAFHGGRYAEIWVCPAETALLFYAPSIGVIATALGGADGGAASRAGGARGGGESSEWRVCRDDGGDDGEFRRGGATARAQYFCCARRRGVPFAWRCSGAWGLERGSSFYRCDGPRGVRESNKFAAGFVAAG